MLNYNSLEIGDKVELWKTTGKVCDTEVTRITKTKVVVSHKTEHYHEHWFKRNNGSDIGPMTTNVYFLR